MVDGRTDGRRTDGWTDGRRLDGYTISSPCEPNGSGELKNKRTLNSDKILFEKLNLRAI